MLAFAYAARTTFADSGTRAPGARPVGPVEYGGVILGWIGRISGQQFRSGHLER